MSRGRYCELVDLGEPYGVVRAQLTKPRAKFTETEWAELVQWLRAVNQAVEKRAEK
jgi:hypothetical protein